MNLEKNIIRKNTIKLRNNLSKEEIFEKSASISSFLFSQREITNTDKFIMFYLSFGSEVSTFSMIKSALDRRKKIAVPAIMTKELIPVRLQDNFEKVLTKTKYGFLEPKEKIFVDIEDIEVVVVPGVAFDLFGRRIGYGKGYYDKFLKDKVLYSIGLCFELQLFKHLPEQKNDVRVCKIITEERVIEIEDYIRPS